MTGRDVQECVVDFDEVEVVRSGQTLVGPVDWTVRGGQHWIVLGPNGSGKTTLLRLAAGYVMPSHGSAVVLGEQLGRVDVRDLRRRIGFVSSALLDVLRPRATATEVVVAGMRAAAAVFQRFEPSPSEWQRAEQLLARFGIGALGDRRFDTLSQGERQRVQLARSLMADPDLLLLDEPTAGIDLAVREQVVDDLASVATGGAGPTTVLVTHRPEDIPRGYTHGLLLNRGAVVAAGPLHEVLTGARLSETFEVPLEIRRRDGRWFAWSP